MPARTFHTKYAVVTKVFVMKSMKQSFVLHRCVGCKVVFKREKKHCSMFVQKNSCSWYIVSLVLGTF